MGHDVQCGRGDFQAQLQHWLLRSPGSELVERERACIGELVADLFGYYLLQVGWTRELGDCVACSRIRHHLSLEHPDAGLGNGTNLIGDPAAFPVAGDTVDVVVLPHTLDFSPDPHQVLREAERVLIPEGRVIIIGFNPWSAWGLWRLFRGRSRGVPWCGNFISARRVMDWLALLGFDVELQLPILFAPPFGSPRILRQLQRLEPIGRRWLPAFSGAYALRAVKRVSTLTPIEPLWKTRSRVLRGQAVEPTARVYRP